MNCDRLEPLTQISKQQKVWINLKAVGMCLLNEFPCWPPDVVVIANSVQELVTNVFQCQCKLFLSQHSSSQHTFLTSCSFQHTYLSHLLYCISSYPSNSTWNTTLSVFEYEFRQHVFAPEL